MIRTLTEKLRSSSTVRNMIPPAVTPTTPTTAEMKLHMALERSADRTMSLRESVFPP